MVLKNWIAGTPNMSHFHAFLMTVSAANVQKESSPCLFQNEHPKLQLTSAHELVNHGDWLMHVTIVLEQDVEECHLPLQQPFLGCIKH